MCVSFRTKNEVLKAAAEYKQIGMKQYAPMLILDSNGEMAAYWFANTITTSDKLFAATIEYYRGRYPNHKIELGYINEALISHNRKPIDETLPPTNEIPKKIRMIFDPLCLCMKQVEEPIAA